VSSPHPGGANPPPDFAAQYFRVATVKELLLGRIAVDRHEKAMLTRLYSILGREQDTAVYHTSYLQITPSRLAILMANEKRFLRIPGMGKDSYKYLYDLLQQARI
jgi:hypothetical protein